MACVLIRTNFDTKLELLRVATRVATATRSAVAPRYIKILMCVCVSVGLSVRDGSGMFVGRDYNSDALPRTSIY